MRKEKLYKVHGEVNGKSKIIIVAASNEKVARVRATSGLLIIKKIEEV